MDTEILEAIADIAWDTETKEELTSLNDSVTTNETEAKTANDSKKEVEIVIEEAKYVTKQTKNQWHQDETKTEEMHGSGTYYLKNGHKYEGEFFKGKKNGMGRFTWKNGDTFEGSHANHDSHVTREKYPSLSPRRGILFKNSQFVKTIPLPPLKFDD